MSKDTFGFDESTTARIVRAVRWVERFRASSSGQKHHRRRAPAIYELVGDTRKITGASDTIGPDDWGKTLHCSFAGAVALTIDQAGLDNGFPQLWWTEVSVPLGAGPVTITPTTSDIAGAASFVVYGGQSIKISSDGNQDSDGGHYRVNTGRAYHTIQDEGSDLTQRPKLDFVGAGVVATDDAGNNRTVVTITGSATGTGPVIETDLAYSMSGNVTDYSLASDDVILRVSPTDLYKWFSTAGGSDGRVVQLINASTTKPFIIPNDDGSTGTAGNRYLTPNGLDYVVGPEEGAATKYDGTSSRWKIIGKTSLGGVVAKGDNSYSPTAAQQLAQTGRELTFAPSSAARTYTLVDASTLSNTWIQAVVNLGSQKLAITPTTSTINGIASIVLLPRQGALIWSDGTNYAAIVTKRAGIVEWSGASLALTPAHHGKLLVYTGSGTTDVTGDGSLPAGFRAGIRNAGSSVASLVQYNRAAGGIDPIPRDQAYEIYVPDTDDAGSTNYAMTGLSLGQMRSTSSDTTITLADQLTCVELTGSSDRTVTLTDANADWRHFLCAVKNNTTGNKIVTINRSGSETINGATSLTLRACEGVWLFTDGGGTWVAITGKVCSPLTTKGDIWCYSTTEDRLPVGTDGQIIYADSGESTGLRWDDPPGGGGSVSVDHGDSTGTTGSSYATVFNISTSYILVGQFSVKNTDSTNALDWKYTATYADGGSDTFHQGLANGDTSNVNVPNDILNSISAAPLVGLKLEIEDENPGDHATYEVRWGIIKG